MSSKGVCIVSLYDVKLGFTCNYCAVVYVQPFIAKNANINYCEIVVWCPCCNAIALCNQMFRNVGNKYSSLLYKTDAPAIAGLDATAEAAFDFFHASISS